MFNFNFQNYFNKINGFLIFIIKNHKYDLNSNLNLKSLYLFVYFIFTFLCPKILVN